MHIHDIFKQFCPDVNAKKLDEYISFCEINRQIDNNDDYCEVHHIMPRNPFTDILGKTIVDAESNLVKLKYNDHVTAHIKLAQACPCRTFARALNFMPYTEEDISNEEIFRILSESAKRGALNFKLKKPDQYEENRRKNRARMLDGQSDLMNSRLKYKLKKDPLFASRINELRAIASKAMWADPVKREYIVDRMHESMTADRIKEISVACKNRYDNMTYDERESFRLKIAEINQRPEKRLKAGEALKRKWMEPEYRARLEALAQRRPDRPEHSEKIKEYWANPEWKDAVLKARAEKYQADKLAGVQRKCGPRAASATEKQREKIVAYWSDPVRKAAMLSNRKDAGEKLKAQWADPVWRAARMAKASATRANKSVVTETTNIETINQ